MMRLLFLVVLAFTSHAYAGGSTLDCPTDYTDDSLETFRDGAVSLFMGGNFSLVSDKLKSCFPSNNLPPCLNELQYENKIKLHGLGQFSSIRELIDYGDPEPERYLTLKSNKDLPKEFRVGDDGVLFPPDILNLAKQKGWKAVNYKTRSTGGFDIPANLTLVAIPGKDKDIFLQISPHPNANPTNTWANPVPEGDPSVGQHTLTIISIDKTQNPPLGQLKLLTNNDGSSYAWDNNVRSQHCIFCHSAPLRSISPRGYLVTNGAEQRMPKETEDIVTEINEMMLVDNMSWGDVTVGGLTIHRGPEMSSQPLGWAPENSETRKDAFIKRCGQQSSEVRYNSIRTGSSRDDVYDYRQSPQHMSDIRTRKVAAAMNCIQCHNNSIRGYLSSAFSPDEVKFKLLVDRSMPPGADLTPDERIALYNCLYDEKRAVERRWNQGGSWFKREACETMDVPAPAGGQTSTTGGTDSTTQ